MNVTTLLRLVCGGTCMNICTDDTGQRLHVGEAVVLCCTTQLHLMIACNGAIQMTSLKLIHSWISTESSIYHFNTKKNNHVLSKHMPCNPPPSFNQWAPEKKTLENIRIPVRKEVHPSTTAPQKTSPTTHIQNIF